MTKPLTGDKLEIAILNAELRGFSELIDVWQAEAQRCARVIEHVKMLHVKKSIDNVDYCVTCAYPSIWDEWQVWPCKTIQALDGEA